MKITRELLSGLTFRTFTKEDYYGFSGVESPVPLIAETDELCVIIDGSYAELYTAEDLFEGLEPTDFCENIRELA